MNTNEPYTNNHDSASMVPPDENRGNASVNSAQEPPKRRWMPIGSVERRVLGVLVEKAKTVPGSYPLTLSALVAGANQKSNRSPFMNLDPEQVDDVLERLRRLGAAALVQGSGRVDKYRHLLHDWFGVERLELAVMAELMLRGAQTEGELRGRASRMEPFPDLAALRPVLNSLMEKGLVVALTPPGRGQVFAHALYLPQEIEKVRREAQKLATSAGETAPGGAMSGGPATDASELPVSPPMSSDSASTFPTGSPTMRSCVPGNERSGDSDSMVAELRGVVAVMRSEIASLKADVERIAAALERVTSDMADLRRDLGD